MSVIVARPSALIASFIGAVKDKDAPALAALAGTTEFSDFYSGRRCRLTHVTITLQSLLSAGSLRALVGAYHGGKPYTTYTSTITNKSAYTVTAALNWSDGYDGSLGVGQDESLAVDLFALSDITYKQGVGSYKTKIDIYGHFLE